MLLSLISFKQVNSWFANRRNRSQNTRPKKNLKYLQSALVHLCNEFQVASRGMISGPEMTSRILTLINYHLKRKT